MSQEINVPVAEIVEATGLSQNSVYRGLKRGDFPGARRIGKLWFYPRAAWNRLLEGRDAQSLSQNAND